MIKIKFNNENIFYEVEFSRTENTVTLKGITKQNSSGFTTYRMSGEQLGDFSEFTTVYKFDDNSVTYSNDDSVYEGTQKPTEEELRKQALLSEKSDLEQWLKAHDYIGVKIATGRATISDYQEEIALMNEKAKRINEINELLKWAYFEYALSFLKGSIVN